MTDKTTDKAECPQLVLVDGSSYLYRAFHVMNDLSNEAGQPTGAVYGVINMLRSLMREYPSPYLAVVFDAKGKTFRHRMYPEYKSHRPPMPDDLRQQIEPLHALIDAMGLPRLVIDDVEADDVIGTLAGMASEAGMSTLVSTGDKDMAQLVNQHVTLINTMSGERLTPEAVEAKFGVPPERIADLLALMGDTSDNIPGVPGVGPKTAAKWLQQFGDLDALIAAAPEIKGKVGERLRDVLDQLPLSRQLTTIDCHLHDHLPQLNDLTPNPVDRDALRRMYADLGFRRWLGELDSPNTNTGLNPDTDSAADQSNDQGQGVGAGGDYEAVLDEFGLERWLELLAGCERFAFDTETTSLDCRRARLVGISLAVESGAACYIPLAHQGLDVPKQLDRTYVLERLKPLLEDASIAKVGQNIKYDRCVLQNYGIGVAGRYLDTMLESYVLKSASGNHDMDSLAKRYLGLQTITFEAVAGKGAKQKTFDDVAVDVATAYAAEDADVTLRLHETLWPQLRDTPRLMQVYEEIEAPLIPILGEMERHGVLVDCDLLLQQSTELSTRLAEIEVECADMAGAPFNLASPRQIQEILFERMGIPVIKKTPKGQPSTAESVLAELADDYPLPRLILEHRSLNKLKTTYTDRLPEQVDPRSGRIHTSYHQAVAATGRLSSSQPNLQNIPVRTREGRRIRQAFIAPPDCRIMAADYSQIELRILAHLSGDPALVEAFSEGADIHRATAAEIFAVPPEGITSDQRRCAKVINFGLIYGMSAFGLAKQLGVDRYSAQQYMDRYFARYPKVTAFMEDTRVSARDNGYVETVFGRRLYLDEIHSRNRQRREYAERAAINAPMQGTAADIIKKAMIRCHDWICESGDDEVVMVMQVHDELVFEVRESALDRVVPVLKQEMEQAVMLTVPLEVEVGIGANWEEAH